MGHLLSLLKGCPEDGGQKDLKLHKRSHGKLFLLGINVVLKAGKGWYHPEDGANWGWGHIGGRKKRVAGRMGASWEVMFQKVPEEYMKNIPASFNKSWCQS